MEEKFFLHSYNENVLQLILNLEKIVPSSTVLCKTLNEVYGKDYWMKALRKENASFLANKNDTYYYIDMDRTDVSFIKTCFCGTKTEKAYYLSHLMEHMEHTQIKNLNYICANCLVNHKKDFLTVVSENYEEFSFNTLERHYKKYHINVNFVYDVVEEDEEEEEYIKNDQVDNVTFQKHCYLLEHALYDLIE